LKKCVKTKIKRLENWKKWAQTLTQEPLNKFNNIKIGTKGSFEKEEPHNISFDKEKLVI
jgi:hypothetical protein